MHGTQQRAASGEDGVVYTWGTRWDQLIKYIKYEGPSHTYGYASEGRTNVTPSAGLRTLYSMCTVRGANSRVGRVDAPGVCGSGVAATIGQWQFWR